MKSVVVTRTHSATYADPISFVKGERVSQRQWQGRLGSCVVARGNYPANGGSVQLQRTGAYCRGRAGSHGPETTGRLAVCSPWRWGRRVDSGVLRKVGADMSSKQHLSSLAQQPANKRIQPASVSSLRSSHAAAEVHRWASRKATP
jgi:hypothetical protein